MNIWKEKENKKSEETKMTGMYIDLETAKILHKNMKRLSEAFKKIEEEKNVNKK